MIALRAWYSSIRPTFRSRSLNYETAATYFGRGAPVLGMAREPALDRRAGGRFIGTFASGAEPMGVHGQRTQSALGYLHGSVRGSGCVLALLRRCHQRRLQVFRVDAHG